MTHKLLYTMMASDYTTAPSSTLFIQHPYFVSEKHHIPLLLPLGYLPAWASPFQDKIKTKKQQLFLITTKSATKYLPLLQNIQVARVKLTDRCNLMFYFLHLDKSDCEWLQHLLCDVQWLPQQFFHKSATHNACTH